MKSIQYSAVKVKDTLKKILSPSIHQYRLQKRLAQTLKRYETLDFGYIVVYDIGARWGLSQPYALLGKTKKLFSVGFEPDANEASNLEASGAFTKTIPTALGAIRETRKLGIAKDPGSSSFLEPDFDEIRRHTDWDGAKVSHYVNVDVCPLDEVIFQYKLPPPDFIKLDVEGFESKILEGATNCLKSVIAITFESRLFPFYKGEKLLPDMLQFFIARGFVVLTIRPIGSFKGCEPMFDVTMVKHPHYLRSARERELGAIIGLVHEKPGFADCLEALPQTLS